MVRGQSAQQCPKVEAGHEWRDASQHEFTWSRSLTGPHSSSPRHLSLSHPPSWINKHCREAGILVIVIIVFADWGRRTLSEPKIAERRLKDEWDDHSLKQWKEFTDNVGAGELEGRLREDHHPLPPPPVQRRAVRLPPGHLLPYRGTQERSHGDTVWGSFWNHPPLTLHIWWAKITFGAGKYLFLSRALRLRFIYIWGVNTIFSSCCLHRWPFACFQDLLWESTCQYGGWRQYSQRASSSTAAPSYSLASSSGSTTPPPSSSSPISSDSLRYTFSLQFLVV